MRVRHTITTIIVCLWDFLPGPELKVINSHLLLTSEVINKLSTFVHKVSPYQGEDLGSAPGILEGVLYGLVDLLAPSSSDQGV